MRKAGRVLAEVMQILIGQVEAGIKTRELDDIAAEALEVRDRRRGVERHFPVDVAFTR